MAIHDRESSSNRWIWPLAILLVVVLVFVLVRQGFFTGSHDTRKAQDVKSTEPSSDTASSRSPKNLAQAAGATAIEQNSSTPLSSSSWYMTVAFKGIVRNETNRAPIDGASVRIYAFSSPPATIEKTTASGGAFQAVAPPAYRYGVKVEAEGFRPYQEDSFVITRPYYDLDIMLSPVLSLRGRVVDNLSAGIGDAQVQLRRFDDRASALISVITDSQGIFTFPEIPRNGRYYVEAYHSGYDAQGLATVSIPADSEVVIRMNPSRSTGSLAGAVTDKGRNPLAGARVSLYDSSDGRLLSTAVTDRQGLYRFPKIREGYHIVRCTADGFADTQANQGIVPIYVNKEARFDFSLDPGLQIRGIVLNGKEEPVVQAQVIYGAEDTSRTRGNTPDSRNLGADRMSPRGGMQRARSLGITATDSEGRFQILGLPDTEAQYQLSVSHRDYQSLVVSLRPSNETQTLVLDPGLSLRGTVSDARGAAVERFSLTFQTTSGRSEKSYSFTTTDGHFEIRGLARDTYQVSLQSQGRGRFSGSLDLQASTEIVVMLDGGRGGRGQSSLSLIKAK